MKRILIISALLVFAGITNAQIPGANENSPESNNNNDHKFANKQSNDFANTEISLREGEVIFSGLPDQPKAIMAVITNSEGEFIKQMKISAQSNIMNVRDLREGSLYFITIIYRNKSKKAFTLNK